MNGRSVVKGAVATAGIVGGLASAAWATQRLAARRIRQRPDDDARRSLDEPLYVDHRLPTHDGGTLFVVESGDGPPVLLSHGVTLSVRTWFHQLELLPKDGLRVIAFDHRGHGQSELGDDGYSIDNLAIDLKTLIVDLDLRDVVLVGHSLGGVAAQAFFMQFPDFARERVKGIVLLSTLAKAPLGSQSTQYKARIERIFKRVPDTTRFWASPNFGLAVARLGFGTDPKPSHVELVRRMMAACSHDTRVHAPRMLVGLDLSEGLPKIDVPTLVIGGTADIVTPPAEAERMAALIPNAQLVLLEGGGHMLMLEKAEEVSALIAGFTRQLG